MNRLTLSGIILSSMISSNAFAGNSIILWQRTCEINYDTYQGCSNWQPESTFETLKECKDMMIIKNKETGFSKTYPNGVDHKIAKGIWAEYKCLPDTIDPR